MWIPSPPCPCGCLRAKNSPIRHKDIILFLLEEVELLAQIIVIHYWGHEKGYSAISHGNDLADRVAGDEGWVSWGTDLEALALLMGPHSLFPKPPYSPTEEAWVTWWHYALNEQECNFDNERCLSVLEGIQWRIVRDLHEAPQYGKEAPCILSQWVLTGKGFKKNF